MHLRGARMMEVNIPRREVWIKKVVLPHQTERPGCSLFLAVEGENEDVLASDVVAAGVKEGGNNSIDSTMLPMLVDEGKEKGKEAPNKKALINTFKRQPRAKVGRSNEKQGEGSESLAGRKRTGDETMEMEERGERERKLW
jgi:hypothetical protein